MDLNINYDETRSIGNQLIAKADEYSSLIDSVRHTNEEITTYWNGSDATKYFQTVGEQDQYMRQLAATIAEIGNYLIRVGNAYEEASQNNANSINLY